jgi:hypothetical protein
MTTTDIEALVQLLRQAAADPFIGDAVLADYIVQAADTIERLTRERDAFKQSLYDEMDGNLRLRELGKARPDEPMTPFIERLIRERDEAQQVCAEAYQVVGVLLDGTGQFETDHGQKILDNLCEHRKVHDDVLPWENAIRTTKD